MSKFVASKENGRHHQLGLLQGNWEGITRTWFEPGNLADESPMKGTIRPVLGGRFMLHEYNGHINGEPFEGMVIYGFDIANNKWQAAWVDSFHMSTGIMFSESGAADSTSFSVLGSYGMPEMPERWGWRTELKLEDADKLVITAWNITPQGEETMATETVYYRVHSTA
ncbi:DUF1579 domain-containing protein [Foetidibacter luteolus]|uniref:DUF1579 domain-containing protein n=1 Tax=Foetidibacter luteolus TaxID=2608880 RepID=UPI00129AC248|nr:DUF1579 domain-containing protein [Foetidibacter luteolus]